MPFRYFFDHGARWGAQGRTGAYRGAQGRSLAVAQKSISLNANHCLVWHKMFLTGKIWLTVV